MSPTGRVLEDESPVPFTKFNSHAISPSKSPADLVDR